MSAITDQAAYVTDDLGHDDRCPRFIGLDRAELPVAGIVSFRLFTSDDTTGGLNLYTQQPHALPVRSPTVGELQS